MKDFYIIDKNEIKRKTALFLTSDDFENFYNAIIQQQHAINVIVNIIYKNFFLDTRLIFFSFNYKSFDDNKAFNVNTFNIN